MTWKQSFTKENDDGTETEIIVTFRYVNNGIGPYEYWGQHCIDTQMEVEFEEAELKDGSDYEASEDEVRTWEENAEIPERD